MILDIDNEWGDVQSIVVKQSQTVYQIIGFDRRNFVGDVTNAIPQNETCLITGLSFESDGIRANGRLTVQVPDERYLLQIDRQLRSVQGLVSFRKTN